MAVMTPRGIERTAEQTVTQKEARMSGRAPKSAGSAVGYQKVPKKKCRIDT